MNFINVVLGVAVPLLLIIFGIIGYFLRTLHSDVKTSITEQAHNYSKMSEDIGKLKGKIELVEQEGRLKYQLVTETTQQEIKNMASKIGELSDTVGQLVTVQLRSNRPS
jgi:predicted PurR-regulated permease PerM